MNIPVPPPSQIDIVFRRAVAIGKRRAIVERFVAGWRTRQGWVRARTRLILQAQDVCRRACGNDKAEGQALYDRLSGHFEKTAAKLAHDQATALAIASGTKPPRRRSFIIPNGAQTDIERHVFESILPFEMARLTFTSHINAHEAWLIDAAKSLPGASYCAETKGIGIDGTTLAAVIGEAGDLAAISTVSALWKRMGLAVINGERQRRVAGDKELALIHGYNAERRAIMWNIGSGMMRANGTMKAIYDERKALYLPRCQEKAAERKGRTGKDGKVTKYSPDGHAHRMAQRYIEKLFLKELWREWSEASLAPIDADCIDEADEILAKAKIAVDLSNAIGKAGLDKHSAAVKIDILASRLAGALRGDFHDIDQETMAKWLAKIHMGCSRVSR